MARKMTSAKARVGRRHACYRTLAVVAVVGLTACGDDPNMDGNPIMGTPAAGTEGSNPSPTGNGMMPGAGMMPAAGTMAENPTMPSAGAGAGAAGTGAAGMAAGTGAAGMAAGTGAAGMAAGTGAAGMMAGNPMMPDNGMMPGDGDYSQYHDPGTGPWEMGSNEDCKMDTSRISGGDNMAVFRYGKLCHIQGGNTNIQNWSATKTLGGVATGRAAYLLEDVPRTGPGTGPLLHEDKVTDWISGAGYGINDEALLNHVMSMTAYNSNLAYGSKRFSYDTLGTREITAALDAAMVALEQIGGSVPTEERAFMQQEVFDKLGMSDSSWPGSTIGYGWTGSLEDMGRVGVMLVHDGWYGGERFMAASWVYRMSHPAHEDANTAYGQLAWLNNRGGGSSFGGAIDRCAPAAFWPEYPHVGSEATDCGATSGSCDQEHDVGVYSAQGLGGQFVVMHPGLDLVITAHNSAAPEALWAAVRPAVVAMDPMYTGDETAFCEAYGAGNYAPDLLVPRIAPTE